MKIKLWKKVKKKLILDEQIINSETDYQFIKLISKGGFANVYQCLKDGQNFALKKIKKEEYYKNEKGYKTEIDILMNKEIEHPNIIKMKEYIERNKIYVLVYIS